MPQEPGDIPRFEEQVKEQDRADTEEYRADIVFATPACRVRPTKACDWSDSSAAIDCGEVYRRSRTKPKIIPTPPMNDSPTSNTLRSEPEAYRRA